MATTIRKSCPHCGQLYSISGPMLNWNGKSKGNPLQTCAKCGKHFFDKDIIEPAFFPPQRRYVTLKDCIFAGFYPFTIIGFLVSNSCLKELKTVDSIAHLSIGYWAMFIIFGFLPVGYWVFRVADTFIHRKRYEEKLRKEYEESLERLKTPEYAWLLKQVGYDVPSRFLVKKRDPKDYTK